MFQFLPYALLLLRLLMGPMMLMAVLRGTSGAWLAVGLTLGLVSDILDGVVARRLNIAHARLRAWDSQVDAIFCVFVLLCVWVGHPDVVQAFRASLLMMMAVQGVSLALDWSKYGRFSSYHAYSSKAAGIAQFLAVLALFGFGLSGWLWWLAIVVAILSHVERIAITLILPRWTHDVPTLYHAWSLTKRA